MAAGPSAFYGLGLPQNPYQSFPTHRRVSFSFQQLLFIKATINQLYSPIQEIDVDFERIQRVI
jgi:hypothetical protein